MEKLVLLTLEVVEVQVVKIQVFNLVQDLLETVALV
jgi:hypothetical protein